MIKLISTDMDGTLLNDEGQLPCDFFEILDELSKKNIKFVVASGRSYCTLYEDFKHRTKDIIYIADNGTCVVENNKVKHSDVLKPVDINKIIETCTTLKNVYPVLCGKKGAHILETPQFVEEIEKYYKNRFSEKNLYNIDDEIYKIGIYDTISSINNSYPVLNSIFGKTHNIVCSGPYWVDIMNKGASKGHALAEIQKDYNILPEETMAFGDFYNDIEMLKQAHYSFVMENAIEDMRQYAKFIAKNNNDCGVTKKIKELIF